MKDRLAEFLKKQELTAVKFAEIMEVQPSSISHLLAGRNKPNFEFIARMILRFPELNPDWILNGQGTMYRSNGEERDGGLPRKPAENYNRNGELFDQEAQERGASRITNVINTKGEETSSHNGDFSSNNRVENLSKITDNEEFNGSNQSITNVTIPSLEPVASVHEKQVKGEDFPAISANLEQIVLFYTDRSFRVYHREEESQ